MPIVGERRVGTVKILGYDYDVVLFPDQGEIRASGDARTNFSKLRIADDLCMQQRVSTMLHECIHLFQFHLGLGLDEESTSRLEVAFFCFLKENGIDLSPLEKMVTDQAAGSNYNTVGVI